MSEPTGSGDEPRKGIDDPDWVDQVVARALANARERAAAAKGADDIATGDRAADAPDNDAGAAPGLDDPTAIDGRGRAPAERAERLIGRGRLPGETGETGETEEIGENSASSPVPDGPPVVDSVPVADASPMVDAEEEPEPAVPFAAPAADSLPADADAGTATERHPESEVEAEPAAALAEELDDIAAPAAASELETATVGMFDEPLLEQPAAASSSVFADDVSHAEYPARGAAMPANALPSDAVEADGSMGVLLDDVDAVAGDELDDDEPPSAVRSLIEWGVVIVGALAVALLIKTFLLQAFYIPSESMVPTLNVEDRVLVNKLSYDFHDVNRGDLIVFGRPPGETGEIQDLIKRVIGLGGETISFRDGSVFIDDRLLTEPYLDGVRTADFTVPDLQRLGCEPIETAGCRIPEGHVFVLGDNRTDSRDSRFFGPIDEDLIVGRAFLRVWPLSEISWL